jgi:ribonuclease P protein component
VINANSEEFPCEVRITKSSDYKALYKTARKIYSDSFILFWRRNRGAGHHRLGITVSRKIGNAVVRNRAKRLFREVFRKTFRTIPGQLDLLINAKPGCVETGYSGLKAEFLAAVQRIGQEIK